MRLDAEYGKEIRRRRGSKDAFRLAAPAHDPAAAGVSSESFKDLVLLIVLIVRIGELALRKLLLRCALPNVIETVGRFIRKPAQAGLR